MSRDIAQEILDEYRKGELFPFFLIEFNDGSNTYRYTTLDVTQTFSVSGGPSGTFTPRGFQFESVTYNMGNVVDDAVIRIDNLDQVMTSIFGDDDIQGQDCKLFTGVLNTSGGTIGTLKFFEGEIDSYELDENEVRMTVTSPFTQWAYKSTGKHSSSCRWKVFKGDECKYSGVESWCDRSYSRCQALGNTDNFGGFRFLPDFENKTLWWGPTPKQRS